MENFSKAYNYEGFETIAVVNKGVYSTSLIQDPFSGTRYVKKELSKEKLPIYQKLQKLKHQGLADIIQVIETEDKIIVMIEYAVGETLRSMLDHKIKLDEKVAISYIQQLASILNIIHQNGIIHRDITPNNIIITTNGQVKLIDFDIARFYKNRQTEDTQLLGTPGYAAPEQFGFNQSTSSSDIYALGVLLNVMITGMKPNEMKINNDGLAIIVKNCTAMEQSLRYQDVMQLDYDLRRLRNTIIPDQSKQAKKTINRLSIVSKVSILLVSFFLLGVGYVSLRAYRTSQDLITQLQNNEESEAHPPNSTQAPTTTDKAQDEADKAQDEADKAQDEVDKVQDEVDKVQDEVDKVQVKVDKAQDEVDKPQVKVDKAQDEANNRPTIHHSISDITAIPSAISFIAPPFNTFIPAPATIFTTPASDNDLGDTFMMIEGYVDGWDSQSGVTFFYLTTDEGTLFIMIPKTQIIFDRFFDYQFDISVMKRGMHIRAYFQYMGFSNELKKGGGTLIGFTEL